MRRLFFSLIELMKQQKGDTHGNRSADSGRHLGERHKLKPFSGAQDRDVAGAALAGMAGINNRRLNRVQIQPFSGQKTDGHHRDDD